MIVDDCTKSTKRQEGQVLFYYMFECKDHIFKCPNLIQDKIRSYGNYYTKQCCMDVPNVRYCVYDK